MEVEHDTLPERMERCLAAISELTRGRMHSSCTCPNCLETVYWEPAHNSPEINDVSKAGYYCECGWKDLSEGMNDGTN